MAIAPNEVLRAGNDTVYLACIYCRSAALEGKCSPQMVSELMDAIHDVPRLLTNWERSSVEEVRNHLGCFNSSKWPGMPDLVAHFNQRLAEYGANAA